MPSTTRTWSAWKSTFCLAPLKRQHLILASGSGEPLGGVHGVQPIPTPAAIATLGTALDNLALAATNNTAVLQQLTAANLARIATITTLIASNKKLVDVAMCAKGTPSGGAPAGSQPGQP